MRGVKKILFAEELHGFIRQDATGDLDRHERRLGGDFRARDHDLIDPDPDLLHRGGKDQPAEAAPDDRAMHITHGSPDV